MRAKSPWTLASGDSQIALAQHGVSAAVGGRVNAESFLPACYLFSVELQ